MTAHEPMLPDAEIVGRRAPEALCTLSGTGAVAISSRNRSECRCSDPEHAQCGMGASQVLVVVVLGDDRKPVFDRRSGDEGVGELDGPVDSAMRQSATRRAQPTMTAS